VNKKYEDWLNSPAQNKPIWFPPLRSPALFVFGLALILRLGYWTEISDTAIWNWERWDQTDMNTFLNVAGQIREGGLLVRDPYHPVHGWHLKIASAEDWRAWALPHTFYQVPGYYYLLAFFLTLSGGSLVPIKVFQMILGAAHASVLSLVGQRIMGRLGGLVVGLLAAVYGPFLALEPVLLREGIGLLVSTLSVYLVLWSLERSARAESPFATLSWLAPGVLLGLGAVTKETGFVLFIAILCWLLVLTVVRPSCVRWFMPVLLLVGFSLGLSPVVLRNLTVGAPAFSFSSNAGVTFMVGNAADLPSGGVIFYEDAPSFKEIMQK
jgi:hypothetical protein